MADFLHTISNEEILELPRAAFAGRAEVVENEAQAAEACDYLFSQSIIGFDTETRPAFKAGVVNRVALLQLSAGERCFLFRLCRMKFEKPIIKLLENDDIVKVGAAIRDDIKALQDLRRFRPRGFVDLQSIVNEWGIEEKSVKKLSAIVLGVSISKAQRLSNWEAASLTPAQISYAATDAWVCRQIYTELMNTPKNNVENNAQTR